MAKLVALLRGINVGGKNILPMAALRAMLGDMGFEGVETYIQSGNCVFDTNLDPSVVSAEIADEIEARFGFRCSVLVLSAGALDAAIGACPFQDVDDPKSLHFYFLSASPPAVDHEQLNALRAESERFALTEAVFYLFAPDGIGRSKLAAKAEAILGVACTARNLRTALKLRDMSAP